MASIVPDLLELMPDTVTAQPGSLDGFGGFTAAGLALTLQCYIESESRLVRDTTGREVASSTTIYVGGTNNLTVEGHRYTLPTRFNPRVDLRAIMVNHMSDEDGAHHEEIVLP